MKRRPIRSTIAGLAAFALLLLVLSVMAQSELEDPRIIIRKSARTLELFDGDERVKTYPIRLGFSPVGDKEAEGDGRTPEGEFYVFFKNEKSEFTASLGLSYPDAGDARRGLAAGLITADEAGEIVAAIASRAMPLQKTKLGGEIYIHGGGSQSDWTDGCVALDDDDALELFAASKAQMPVTILP